MHKLQAAMSAYKRVSSHASVMAMNVESTPVEEQVIRLGSRKAKRVAEMQEVDQSAAPVPQSRALQETVNALTMLPHTYFLLVREVPAPLVFRIAVVLHTCASMTFHMVLVGIEKQTPQFIAKRPWLGRAAMDLDMCLIFAVGLICTVMNATSVASASVGVILGFYSLYGIATSRAVAKADIDAELVGRRYPLLFVTIMYEALLAWLCRGDATNAAGIAISICAIGTFSLADKALGGWGHPIGHLACVPGIWFRSEALIRTGW